MRAATTLRGGPARCVYDAGMTEPVLHHLSCPDAADPRRLAWWQWGNAAAPHLVVCVHGLSRQGRDFDTLARALLAQAAAQGRAVRVVCPDMAGRGESDWLADPARYQVPTYVADTLALLAHWHAQAPVRALDWVGTSMGGLIGMSVAGAPGLPLPAPVRRLVLNDVGPRVEWAALARIGQYLGRTGPFATAQEGGWRMHYDPAIAVPLASLTPEALAQGEAALWPLYDAIQAPTLLLRGADSDLLSPATARQMAARGPRARVCTFAGVGHAPTLVAPAQTAAVCNFLLSEAA